MKTFASFAAAAVLGLAGMANAATVTYNAPYSISPIGGPATPVLPYYTGDAGTLTSVTIWFDGAASGTFTFVVGASPSDTANATLASAVFATFTPSGTLLADNETTGLLAPALNAGESDAVGVGGGTYNYPALSLAGGPANPALAPYYGVGNFNVNMTTTGGWTFQVNGSGEQGLATVQFNSTVAGNVHVRYDYAVPEPASLALLAIGGLALIRRRRDR